MAFRELRINAVFRFAERHGRSLQSSGRFPENSNSGIIYVRRWFRPGQGCEALPVVRVVPVEPA